MATSTHLLVGNPTAQSGRNAERIKLAVRLLSERGVICDVLATQPEGRTIGLVQAALDGGAYRCVISMGGDGTFREVASGLLQSKRRDDLALGMLPTGTANDQGKSFGLEADEAALPGNIDVICQARETQLDAGKIRALDALGTVQHEAFFFDSAGWGLSARILAERNEDRRLVEKIPGLKHIYRDQMVYAGATVKSLLGSYVVSDKFTVHIESGGQRRSLTRLSDLVIKATRIYGGAWVFDPTSRHDDGLFEVVPARGRRDWAARVVQALEHSIIPEQALDALGIEPSEIFRGEQFDLRFEVPVGNAHLAAQIDGEEFTPTPRVRINVFPRALRLIVPSAGPHRVRLG